MWLLECPVCCRVHPTRRAQNKEAKGLIAVDDFRGASIIACPVCLVHSYLYLYLLTQSKEAKVFAEAGKEADDIQFVKTDNADVAKLLGITANAPAIALVKKLDDKFVAYGE